MVKRAAERSSDRVLSIALSVLVHAVIVGALVWGWWQYRTPKSAPQTLAIRATVVRNAQPQRSPTPPQPPAPTAPPTPPTPPATPPAPPPAPANDAALAAQQARDRAEAQQRAAAQATAQAAAAKAAEEAAAAKAAAEEDAKREAKLAAERKAKEEAEARAKQEAAHEAQLLAQQLKAEQAEQQREADLRTQLQAEEHLNALQQGPAEQEYLSLIQARISRAWIRPPSAQPGLKCTVHLTQIPGGEITNVTVEGCNGDEAVRQSVATAAYRASPLPAPSDPALFDPDITVTFAPDQ